MVEYRKVVEAQMSGPVRFTLFPKDALEKRGNLTVLLRKNLQTFDIRWLPKAILMRSCIRGGLRLTHIKHYRPEDTTRDGVSKRGWHSCRGVLNLWRHLRNLTTNTGSRWGPDTLSYVEAAGDPKERLKESVAREGAGLAK